MLFPECCIIHEPREESLDGVSGFPVSLRIQIIGETPESLFITVCFARVFNSLLLVFLGNILQNRPRTMDLAHLLGCTEGGG